MITTRPAATASSTTTAFQRGRALACSVLSLLAMSVVLSSCARGDTSNVEPLLVFAASDLRDALSEVARDYREAGGDSAVLVFGSTGDLATQIANGAPADLFFAANAEAVDALAERGSIVDSTREVYAIGRLAVIARCTSADTSRDRATGAASDGPSGVCPRLSLTDLLSDSLRTIAIADPAHAPYGRAAQQALEAAGVWEGVKSKLILGANISQAEIFVTSGNADAGIVALSLLKRGVQRVYTPVDSSLHAPLMQTVAIVSRSTRQSAARAFVTYMQSAVGRAVMDRYGFSPPPPAGASHDS